MLMVEIVCMFKGACVSKLFAWQSNCIVPDYCVAEERTM